MVARGKLIADVVQLAGARLSIPVIEGAVGILQRAAAKNHLGSRVCDVLAKEQSHDRCVSDHSASNITQTCFGGGELTPSH